MTTGKDRIGRWVYDGEEHDNSDAVKVPELLMLGYDHFTEALRLSQHEHDGAFEFVFIESGKVTWEVNGQHYETRAGEMFHTRPNEPHRARMDYMEPCSIWWMIVTMPSTNSSWLGLSKCEADSVIEKLQSLPRVLRTNAQLKISFSRLQHALRTEAQPWLKLKVRHFVLDLILNMTEPPPDLHIPEDLQAGLRSIVENMQRNPEKHWNNRDIAASIGISESHFYRLFRQSFGQSPSSFVERKRVEYAAQLLMHSDAPITSLALTLDFKTSQHFSTVFKKVTGITPSQWRAAHHKSTSE
ncbi:AraC family transcriptional regulator [Paenibacillus sp. JDR-2]|uniref:AraC family transcriptional regulator n=1 Tax=Paenibacillus sp. (strain JDR-2) TaxID=324057 RepID=UPI000166BB7A|nr:AraC family transcriptional regulator [Paenibacillus sp. JDR-2]ACT01849.1 transcriptional regulator, AraC family [Paenibacillus sp. JDR-2]